MEMVSDRRKTEKVASPENRGVVALRILGEKKLGERKTNPGQVGGGPAEKMAECAFM